MRHLHFQERDGGAVEAVLPPRVGNAALQTLSRRTWQIAGAQAIAQQALSRCLPLSGGQRVDHDQKPSHLSVAMARPQVGDLWVRQAQPTVVRAVTPPMALLVGWVRQAQQTPVRAQMSTIQSPSAWCLSLQG